MAIQTTDLTFKAPAPLVNSARLYCKQTNRDFDSMMSTALLNALASIIEVDIKAMSEPEERGSLRRMEPSRPVMGVGLSRARASAEPTAPKKPVKKRASKSRAKKAPKKVAKKAAK